MSKMNKEEILRLVRDKVEDSREDVSSELQNYALQIVEAVTGYFNGTIGIEVLQECVQRNIVAAFEYGSDSMLTMLEVIILDVATNREAE